MVYRVWIQDETSAQRHVHLAWHLAMQGWLSGVEVRSVADQRPLQPVLVCRKRLSSVQDSGHRARLEIEGVGRNHEDFGRVSTYHVEKVIALGEPLLGMRGATAKRAGVSHAALECSWKCLAWGSYRLIRRICCEAAGENNPSRDRCTTDILPDNRAHTLTRQAHSFALCASVLQERGRAPVLEASRSLRGGSRDCGQVR
jgi:hypothetical protein